MSEMPVSVSRFIVCLFAKLPQIFCGTKQSIRLEDNMQYCFAAVGTASSLSCLGATFSPTQSLGLFGDMAPEVLHVLEMSPLIGVGMGPLQSCMTMLGLCLNF